MYRRLAKICCLLLCACLMAGSISVGAADNLALSGDLFMEGTTLSAGASFADGAGPEGEKALVLEGSGAEAYFYADNLEANKTYGFSAMLKSNKNGAAAIKVEAVTKAEGAYSAVAAANGLQHYKYTAGTDTYVSTDNAWRPLQFNFTLPQGANAAKITVSCKEAGETVSFADFDVYVAANLVSNGDFEGVSVYDANPTNVSGGLVLDTTGTPGNWRFKKADPTINNMMRNPVKTWGATHFTKEEAANPQGYAYAEAGAKGYGISQVIPVKTGRMYRLAFDWGVWHTDGAAVMQLWSPVSASSSNMQWVHSRLGTDYVSKKTWAHTEYFFFVSENDAVANGMGEVCLYWNDNSGKGRTVIDNVILEPVNNTVTTAFSEKYAVLDTMPEGGDTTVTVKNTYRIPKNAGNDGQERVYKNYVCLYKIEDGIPQLVNVSMEKAILTPSTTADAIKTLTLDIDVPKIVGDEEYKIVSFTWNDKMSARISPVTLSGPVK